MGEDVSSASRAIFPRKSSWFAAVVALLASLLTPLHALPTQNEYAVKSAFLYNFCRFIDWPDSAFMSPTDPFVIGIAGDDPFGSLLNETIKGKKYRKHPIRVDHFRGPGDIKRCHLLFVSRANAGRLDSILGAVAGKNVLTVSETDDFLNRGGMITLRAEQNRVRLRIGQVALHSTNLVVSSKLLRIAEIKP